MPLQLDAKYKRSFYSICVFWKHNYMLFLFLCNDVLSGRFMRWKTAYVTVFADHQAFCWRLINLLQLTCLKMEAIMSGFSFFQSKNVNKYLHIFLDFALHHYANETLPPLVILRMDSVITATYMSIFVNLSFCAMIESRTVSLRNFGCLSR